MAENIDLKEENKIQEENEVKKKKDMDMKTFKRIQIVLLTVVVLAIGVFSYVIYASNFAYSKHGEVTDDGTYYGEFKGTVYNGEGTLNFVTGITYKGEWKDGYMEGYGVLISKDGSKYEGEFVEGFYDGNGKITTAKGSILEGVWKKGKLIKTIKKTTK